MLQFEFFLLLWQIPLLTLILIRLSWNMFLTNLLPEDVELRLERTSVFRAGEGVADSSRPLGHGPLVSLVLLWKVHSQVPASSWDFSDIQGESPDPKWQAGDTALLFRPCLRLYYGDVY